jgi:hypothetical protein
VSNEYLWDRSGPPDPEVARLEALLGTLRQTPPELPALADVASLSASAPASMPVAPLAQVAPVAPVAPLAIGSRPLAQTASAHAIRYVIPFAIAATLVVAAGLASLSVRSNLVRPSWQVSRLEGAPTIAAQDIGNDGRLAVGGWLETDANARARIAVGRVGRVDVDPRSRVGLLSTRAGNYRLQLARGTLHALIWAPPGQFFVETPSSTAVDLGCAYTLRVDDDGAGMVEVTSGWVGFEWKGKESFIPAGARGETRPGVGPGTPHYADVSPAFQAALTTLDFARVTPEVRAAALSRVLSESREHDAVTLWHLLSRVEAGDRDRVFDRLAAFVPPPPGVTRDGIRVGTRAMLDRWWDELGLGSMQLWRGWKQAWREN